MNLGAYKITKILYALSLADRCVWMGIYKDSFDVLDSYIF